MRIRLGIAAGLLAGAVVATVDIAVGLSLDASLGGGIAAIATIIALDLTAGLVFGAVQAGLLVALGDDAWVSNALLVVRRRLAAVVAGPLQDRSVHAARTFAAMVFAIVTFGGLTWLAAHALGEPRVTFGVANRHALVAALWIGLAAMGARGLVAPLTSLAERVAPRVSFRWVLGFGAVAGVAVIVAARAELTAFARAVDVRPLVLALVFVVVDILGLVAIATSPRCDRWSRTVTRRAAVVALAIVLVGGWVVALGPASQSPSAQRIYRKDAPFARIVATRLAALLDFDEDGYSAYFGDGDCAPFDEARGPGTPEVPGNGIDDDCFDGDLTAAATQPPPAAPLPESVPADLSFVVVLVDALRADHMGVYGYARDTTPHIDAFARDAVVFERAYAPSSYTYASVPAIMTGQFPSMLPRKIMRKKGTIAEDDQTMAQLLQAAGYATALVTDGASVLNDMGLGKGFAQNKVLHDVAKKVTDSGIGFVEDHVDQRFLLVLHYIAPHSPYRTHDDAPDFGDEFFDLYDHEIAHVDANVGRLLGRITELGLRDRVAVIITSDHGEAFGEHGTYYHGHNLHEENVRVPLLIAAPSASPARYGAGVVSLVDVFPTVLHLARVAIPTDARGYALTPQLFSGQEQPDRYAFIESLFTGYNTVQGYQAAVVGARYKLIQDDETRTFLLFDLVEDPGERENLFEYRSDLALELRRMLARFRAQAR